MTAFIEVVNGIGSFVSARENPWHMLGHVKPDGYLDMDEMLRLSNADYTVEKIPVVGHHMTANGITSIESPTHAMTVRQHPTKKGQLQQLGIVGKDYKVFQPREAAEFGYGLLATEEAIGETAGVLHDGKRVFFSFRLKDILMVGGRDPVATYLGIYTGFDGSIAYTAMLTDIRIVCKNTVNMALSSAKYKWTLRHTKHANLAANKDRALEVLGLAHNYREHFAAAADKLINITVTKQQFDEIITKEFGPKDDAAKRGLTLWDQQRDRLLWLFDKSDTQDDIRGTGWGAYNAMVEYQDWYRTVPKVAPEDQQAAQFVRSVETTMDDRKAATDPKAVMLRRVLALAS